jgi:hypothetical protein
LRRQMSLETRSMLLAGCKMMEKVFFCSNNQKSYPEPEPERRKMFTGTKFWNISISTKNLPGDNCLP